LRITPNVKHERSRVRQVLDERALCRQSRRSVLILRNCDRRYWRWSSRFLDSRSPVSANAKAVTEPPNTTGQLLTALETLKPLVVQAEGGTAAYAQSPSNSNFGAVNNDAAELWLLTATGTPIRQVLPSSVWQSEARWDPASS
jgi:hypothetical protein